MLQEPQVATREDQQACANTSSKVIGRAVDQSGISLGQTIDIE